MYIYFLKILIESMRDKTVKEKNLAIQVIDGSTLLILSLNKIFQIFDIFGI